MAYHALLDWRVALDMVNLALDQNAPIGFGTPYWQSVLAQINQPYFNGLGMSPTTFAGASGRHQSMGRRVKSRFSKKSRFSRGYVPRGGSIAIDFNIPSVVRRLESTGTFPKETLSSSEYPTGRPV
jgi:hypothetical protein